MRTSLALLSLLILAACNSGSGEADAPAADAPATEAAPASQPEPAPELDAAMVAAVEVRQSALKLIRHNFVPVLLMVRGEIPFNGDVAATNATRLHQLSMMLGDTFSKDTRGSGVPTEALDRIWEEPDLFAEKAAAFVTASASFAEIAAGGDQAAVSAAFGDVGKSCGGCHDEFREDN